ncbi:tRNA1(Val) (adenine(37)-N6)-methyltransferase [[Mannheimia] succiniciproducens]|nr:tRNA1(Val) (adenine(37)-N6)-methyltransferase [[Mannheimia] succiniciproducens]
MNNKTKSAGFTFKQFHVSHDKCAMKVGTDGILLGAWASLQGNRYLDLGTGSGLIALMLAQRTQTDCHITGVEIDPSAYRQATENVRQSPWADKIQLEQQNIVDFTRTCTKKFDTVLSNPPYFEQGVDCRDKQRDTARYTQTLSHSDWLNLAADCLTNTGRIHLILPYAAGKNLQKQTALFCARCCEVITKSGKIPQRLLLTFSKQPCTTEQSRLVVYNEQNQYTEQFIALTRDFYLNF